MTINRIGLGAALIAGALSYLTSPARPQSFPGTLPSGYVWGNPSAATARAVPSPLTSLLDRNFGSATARLMVRGASAWGAIAPSGDLTMNAAGAFTFNSTGVTPSTYGDSTHVGQFTVDAKGRITAASNIAISGGGGMPGAPDTSVQYNNAGAFGGLSFLVKSGASSLQLTGVLNVDNYLNNGTHIELNNNANITLFDTSSLTYTSVAQLSSPLHGNNSNNGLMLAGAGATTLDSSDGGFLQESELQESNTTNRAISYNDLATSFDNTGASGEVDFTLPDPTLHVKGQVYSFCVTAAQTLKIIATGGAKIYRGGTVTGANGNISSNTVGSCIKLISRDFGAGMGYSGTDWVAKSITGTWM